MDYVTFYGVFFGGLFYFFTICSILYKTMGKDTLLCVILLFNFICLIFFLL